jgi:hypothetical protein
MDMKLRIPRGYQDVAARTLREIFGEIDAGIICIIKYQHPLILARGEPARSVLIVASNGLSESNIFEPALDCVNCAGIKEENIGEAVQWLFIN